MKKLISLFLLLGLLVVFPGCSKKEESASKVQLPFKPADVQNVLMLQRSPDGIDKAKLEVMDQKPIAEAYDACAGFEVAEKEWDGIVTSDGYTFAFNLKDGSQYELTYYPLGENEGRLVSAAGAFDYFTTSDVMSEWERIYKSLSSEEK